MIVKQTWLICYICHASRFKITVLLIVVKLYITLWQVFRFDFCSDFASPSRKQIFTVLKFYRSIPFITHIDIIFLQCSFCLFNISTRHQTFKPIYNPRLIIQFKPVYAHKPKVILHFFYNFFCYLSTQFAINRLLFRDLIDMLVSVKINPVKFAVEFFGYSF